MKPRNHRTFSGDSLKKTTKPLALTDQQSANGIYTRKVFHHHYQHRLGGAELEFVNHIVEFIELASGLVATGRQQFSINSAAA